MTYCCSSCISIDQNSNNRRIFRSRRGKITKTSFEGMFVPVWEGNRGRGGFRVLFVCLPRPIVVLACVLAFFRHFCFLGFAKRRRRTVNAIEAVAVSSVSGWRGGR